MSHCHRFGRIAGFTLGLCVLIAAAGHACAEGAAADQQYDLLQPGKLTVGLTFAYAPYSYLKNGKPAGFDVEALRLVAKELGLTPVFKNTKFSQAILSVEHHNIDLTPGLYMTPERARVLTLVPYFSAGTAIVVRVDDASPPKTKMDLCGLKISSIKGAAVVGKIREETNPACRSEGKKPIEAREFPTDPGATQALLSGAVDAQLTETIIAQTVVAKTGDRLKISSSEPLYPVQVGWGVSKDHAALAKALSQALQRAIDSGEYQKLLSKYNLDLYDPKLAREAVQSAH